MADMLSTGISGLLAFQTALATTSHNISNVNTTGYSRQVTDLVTRTAQPTGSGYIGSGVQVASVQREYDQFLTKNLQTQTTLQQKLSGFQSLASQVDNALSDSTAGLAPALQQFFDAVQGVADTPSSTSARQVMVSEGQTLVDTFHTLGSNFSSLNDSVNTQLSNSVDTVNSLATSIASLNKQIASATAAAGGQPPNDLLDQRDELIQQLAEQVPVTTVQQDDGSTNVFIGNGQVLVLGSDANQLKIIPNAYDQGEYEIAMSDGTNITSQITSGTMGGVLSFRSSVLQPAENALGQVAIGLSQTFNTQQTQGMDLNNDLGTDFFGFTGVTAAAQALPSENNSATAPTVTYTVTDPSSLTTSDYLLSTADGTTYTLTRLSDHQVVGTYTPTSYPATINVSSEGLSLQLSGAASAGDSYEIEPTRNAASDITQLITDPSKIAAALPVATTLSTSNLGSAEVSDLSVSSSTNLSTVLSNGTLNFTFNATNNQYVVSGAVSGTIPYDPSTDSSGVSVDLGTYLGTDYSGLTFNLSGTPLDGDSFMIFPNSNAVNDNGNALKLSAIDTSKVLSGGTASIQDAYSQIVSDVGTKTSQANTDLTSQNAVVTQAKTAQQAVSGVNLDEEAANMLTYQQAYQACAQIINTAKTLFDTLINAVG